MYNVQQWNVRKLKESLRVSHKTDVYNQSNLWLERMRAFFFFFKSQFFFVRGWNGHKFMFYSIFSNFFCYYVWDVIILENFDKFQPFYFKSLFEYILSKCSHTRKTSCPGWNFFEKGTNLIWFNRCFVPILTFNC